MTPWAYKPITGLVLGRSGVKMERRPLPLAMAAAWLARRLSSTRVET